MYIIGLLKIEDINFKLLYEKESKIEDLASTGKYFIYTKLAVNLSKRGLQFPEKRRATGQF